MIAFNNCDSLENTVTVVKKCIRRTIVGYVFSMIDTHCNMHAASPPLSRESDRRKRREVKRANRKERLIFYFNSWQGKEGGIIENGNILKGPEKKILNKEMFKKELNLV